jgi:hypothetical protein
MAAIFAELPLPSPACRQAREPGVKIDGEIALLNSFARPSQFCTTQSYRVISPVMTRIGLRVKMPLFLQNMQTGALAEFTANYRRTS